MAADAVGYMYGGVLEDRSADTVNPNPYLLLQAAAAVTSVHVLPSREVHTSFKSVKLPFTEIPCRLAKISALPIETISK
jgi:hypothetical protein